MDISIEDFLRYVEGTGEIATFDIESTGLKGDYNSVLCVSIKRYGRAPVTGVVKQPGDDKELVIWAREELNKLACWISYYGKGFDFPMLNTRLLNHGERPLLRKPHIDMYFSLRSSLLTGRRSQGHLLNWLGTKEQKMSVGADVWNRVLASPAKELPQMVKRCESDVRGLECLYKRTKHLIKTANR